MLSDEVVVGRRYLAWRLSLFGPRTVRCIEVWKSLGKDVFYVVDVEQGEPDGDGFALNVCWFGPVIDDVE